MAKKSIDRCPHCGSDWGVYTKIDYLRVRADYGFDGEPQFNLGDIADCAEERREGKVAYCQKCGKEICHMRTLKKQWGEGVFQLSAGGQED